ncbi:MAG: hypothetical protein MJB57_07935, partial [Gemmatimonadetes bacterium]|nr:hypothetical protein [Gemmatimonadota bacterium]
VAAAIPVWGGLADRWPVWAAGGALIAVGSAARPARTVWRYADPRELNAALVDTARAVGAYGVLFAAGCLA